MICPFAKALEMTQKCLIFFLCPAVDEGLQKPPRDDNDVLGLYHMNGKNTSFPNVPRNIFHACGNLPAFVVPLEEGSPAAIMAEMLYNLDHLREGSENEFFMGAYLKFAFSRAYFNSPSFPNSSEPSPWAMFARAFNPQHSGDPLAELIQLILDTVSASMHAMPADVPVFFDTPPQEPETSPAPAYHRGKQ